MQFTCVLFFLNAARLALQEERLRRTLQRELPRITDELRALLEQVPRRSCFARVVLCCAVWCCDVQCAGAHFASQWEASEESSFMLNGVSLLQSVIASGGGSHSNSSP